MHTLVWVTLLKTGITSGGTHISVQTGVDMWLKWQIWSIAA